MYIKVLPLGPAATEVAHVPLIYEVVLYMRSRMSACGMPLGPALKEVVHVSLAY